MSARFHDARLTVDLEATVANWRVVGRMVAPARAAAVLKADGYGMGAAALGTALARAGCRTFFVAHPAEGVLLRPHLPDADIFILHGATEEAMADLKAARLIPVLDSMAQIKLWGDAGPAALHVDTGMMRTGVLPPELPHLQHLKPVLLLSHLACADEANHPLNNEQRLAFATARAHFPGVPASLANSAGCFLGPDYSCDVVRPGIALHGVDPRGGTGPFRPTVRLEARILQIREIPRVTTVGYGATHRAAKGTRVATIALGYADGWLRTLSNRGFAVLNGQRIPLIGRVSMDLVTLDVSSVPPEEAQPGAWVTLIGPGVPLAEVASLAGTSEYEVLVRLGPRISRRYTGQPGIGPATA